MCVRNLCDFALFGFFINNANYIIVNQYSDLHVTVLAETKLTDIKGSSSESSTATLSGSPFSKALVIPAFPNPFSVQSQDEI